VELRPFRFRSTLVGLLGIGGFLRPPLVLRAALLVYAPAAGWVHVARTFYVLAYDVPQFYEIRRLDPRC